MQGDVPMGWSSTTLSKIAAEGRGRFLPGISKPAIPYVGLEHLDPGMTKLSRFGSSEDIISQKTVFGPDDILFGKLRPYLRKVAFADRKGVCSTDILAIHPRQGTDARFLLMLLSWQKTIDFASASAAGTKMPRTSWYELAQYEVLLPPLPEQKKIAAILSSVDEAIQTTQALIDQTRRVKEGLLQELLTKGIGHTRFKQTEIGEIPEGWEVRPLSALSSLITSGPRGWAEYYAEDGALFLRSQNIRDGYLDWSDQVYVHPPEGAETERARLQSGDILITITGNNVGNVSIFDGVGRDAFASQHVGVIRLLDPTTCHYLAAFLSPSGPGQACLMQQAYGQAKPGLGLAQLRNLMVPVIPDDERHRIDFGILEVNSLLLRHEEALKRLRITKSGILQDLLTGKVRVTV